MYRANVYCLNEHWLLHQRRRAWCRLQGHGSLIYRAKVTLYDERHEVIVTDYAYGNTKRTCDAAAGALCNQLEDEHDGSNGIVGRAVPGMRSTIGWWGD